VNIAPPALLFLLALLLAGCRAESEHVITFDEARENRRRCFNGQHILCECENPGTDAEARYCAENDL